MLACGNWTKQRLNKGIMKGPIVMVAAVNEIFAGLLVRTAFDDNPHLLLVIIIWHGGHTLDPDIVLEDCLCRLDRYLIISLGMLQP